MILKCSIAPKSLEIGTSETPIYVFSSFFPPSLGPHFAREFHHRPQRTGIINHPLPPPSVSLCFYFSLPSTLPLPPILLDKPSCTFPSILAMSLTSALKGDSPQQVRSLVRSSHLPPLKSTALFSPSREIYRDFDAGGAKKKTIAAYCELRV